MAEGAPGLRVLMDVAEMGILLLVVKEGLGEKEGHLSVRGMRLHKLLDRQPAEAGGSSRWCVQLVGNGGPGGSDGVQWKSGCWGQGSLGSVRARPHLTYCKGFAMKLAVVGALKTSKLRTFKIT